MAYYSKRTLKRDSPMRTVLFIPPLPRMTGGIAVLYQVAEHLRALGLSVALTSTHETAPGLVQQKEAGFTVLPWDSMQLNENCCYLVPEGWPNALAPALKAKARALVYVQNWAYLLSALPGGVSWQQLPVSFLAVSQPVAHFVDAMLGLPLTGVVRPAVDVSFFRPGNKPESHVRIAWMPRKNKAMGDQIRQVTEGLLRRSLPSVPVQWVEVHRMTRAEVAGALATSHIFLCTGFPEGFALPPLEAIACACLPVGFSGFGGWDYMRQARAGGYVPNMPLRDVPWLGNGFFAADGDVIEASLALEEAVHLVAGKNPVLDSILAQGRSTVESYSLDAQRNSVAALWKLFPSSLTSRTHAPS